MPLSRDNTALDVYKAAVRDFPLLQNSVAYILRFTLINEATDAVVGLFYDLLKSSYMSADTIVAGGAAGTVLSSGSPNWTAATNTISGATMTTPFASATHTGWLIVFWDSSFNVYCGTISQVLSATSVIVSGNNLPSTDITGLSGIACVATTPTGNSASLTGLRIMRASQETKIQLESTATPYLEFTNEQGIFTFRSGAKPNAIVWALSGDQLLLGKGSSVSSYQTLTIRYPRSPIRVTLDTSPMDVPDGVVMTLVIIKLRQLIAKMSVIDIPDQTAEYMAAIKQLYETFGQAVTSEVIEDKTRILKG